MNNARPGDANDASQSPSDAARETTVRGLAQRASGGLSGLSLVGGKADKRGGGAPLPGSPLIRIRAFTLLGGVGVADRPPGKLIDPIRDRRDKSTGAWRRHALRSPSVSLGI